jgi:hypothetical protein
LKVVVSDAKMVAKLVGGTAVLLAVRKVGQWVVGKVEM